jgi:signal transduction histidine kinase/DNA-binding NarL/FixJ family response regulator
MSAQSGLAMAAPEAPPQPAPGLCVLLVDDDEADAYLIDRALGAHPEVGRVVHAKDGVEALALVQRGGLEPDIAFIDLRMPRMDGLQLLVALANGDDHAFPMVVLTSSSSPDDAVRGRLRSADSVIIKPDNIVEMSAALRPSIDAVRRRGAAADPRRGPGYIRNQAAARDAARTAAALRSAATLAKIGGWELDFVTQSARFAPELCELLGAPQSEMSIAESSAFWAQEDRPGFAAALERSFQHGERLSFHGRSQTQDGSFRYWRVIGEPVLVNGFCIALQGVAQEVTEWREGIDREVAAIRTTEAMSLFLATMSHELRTPLNGVLGMAQAMGMDEMSPQQRERLSVIKTSGEALLALLNDLLDFAKIEAGKVELEEGILATRALADETLALFAPIAQAKSIDLSIHVTAAAEGSWSGDPVRVRQILHNLISNALKFTDLGAVSVTISHAKGRLFLRVQDTGTGIPANLIGQIFDRFFQADTSITRRFGGAGLGLTISRDLARMMGGDIEVESAPGSGSTFVVSLPSIRRDEDRTFGAEGPHQSSSPGLRVLAAEDNLPNQRVLSALLEAVGIQLTIVSNGREALDMWRAADWDLILMDIQMPVMDGIAAASLIRVEERQDGRARTPIIAVTANTMALHRQQYLAAGMDDVVPKPINLAALLGAIDKAAGQDLQTGPPQEISAEAC